MVRDSVAASKKASAVALRWLPLDVWGGGASAGNGGGYGGGGYSQGPREMHDATCARCGNETQVPFRPTGARPVYCSDCFRMMRG